jgi:hypothetical protein
MTPELGLWLGSDNTAVEDYPGRDDAKLGYVLTLKSKIKLVKWLSRDIVLSMARLTRSGRLMSLRSPSRCCAASHNKD